MPADNQETTKKTLRPEGIPRVEGHGGIVLEVLDDQVKSVNVAIYEGPRLIEMLAIGKTPVEDMSLTSRICAICTLSHRYAAIRGLEKCMGYSNLPKKVGLTRELMHLSESIESNSLHVFYLSAPDLLGFPSVVAMYGAHPELVARALRLKQLGTELMKACAGRKIHGENATTGGFYGYPSTEQLLASKQKAIECLPQLIEDVVLLSTLDIPDGGDRDMVFMALVPENGEFGFVADTVGVLKDCNLTTYPVKDYRQLTNERNVAHSFAKRCRYQDDPFFVGALARMLILKDKLGGKAGELLRKIVTPQWYRSPIYNILAQAVEIIYCVERMIELIDKIVELPDEPLVPPPRIAGEGVGAVEAPRGILYHEYTLGEDGLVAKCNIITPTAQFLDDVEESLTHVAKKLLADPAESDDSIRDKLETVVRSYDPCISCSCHMVELRRLYSSDTSE